MLHFPPSLSRRVGWIAAVAAALSAGPLHAEPRSGGVYDRPLLVRTGTDDLGMTLGAFADCAEKTLHQAASRGTRGWTLNNTARVIEGRDAVTVMLDGRSGPFRLNFHITPQAAYMISAAFPSGRVYRDFETKRLLVSMLNSACTSQGRSRHPTNGDDR